MTAMKIVNELWENVLFTIVFREMKYWTVFLRAKIS